MVRKLVLAVTAAGALMSSNMIQALGVGEINLRSALNQPLEAEIELLQIRDLNSTEIRSMLASPDDFGKAGVDRTFFLTDLTFTPVVQPDGKAYIRVTSNRPVKEPYLNFLMEVRWPSGRVLREFTLLLDPPLYEPTPVTVNAPSSSSVAVNSGAVSAPPSTVTPAPAPRTAPMPHTGPSTAAAADRQRRTNRSDTLWTIALEARPQDSSVYQTMLAIQDLNPDAFIGGNINNLKAGQNLILPNAEQTATRSLNEAIAEVNNQTSAWQNRQPTREPAQRQLDARERSVASDAPSQTRREDSLRLVAGDAENNEMSGAASGAQSGELRGALEQTREQLDSAEQAKAELTERLAEVEGQLETLQRLLTLKDAQLAALQRELADTDALPDILPIPENEEGLPAEALADISLPAAVDQLLEQPSELAEFDNAEPFSSEPDADALSVVEGDEEQLALAPVAPPTDQSDADSDSPALPSTEASAPSASEAQPDTTQSSNSPEALLQRFMQNQTLLLGTGAVALLLLLLIFRSISRRNARQAAENDDDMLSSSPIDDNAAFAEESESFNVALADIQDGPETTEDVADPLVIADELISSDELNEAAEMLEVAIEQEPARADLRLKMMEVEARLENQEGYAIQLEALKRMGVAESAVEMMNARYPLMAAGLVTGVALLDNVADAEQSHADAFGQSLQDETEVQADPFAVDEDTDFDFADFGLEEDAAASLADTSEQEIGFDLDFDLDEDSSADAEPVVEEAADPLSEPLTFSESPLEPVPTSAVVDDFDLNLDEELQADNLLAELEAMGAAEVGVPQPVDSTLEADEDDSFTLTDDDLASFEAQLQSEMQRESAVDDVADYSEEPANTAGQSPSTASDDLMMDGLDEDFDFLSDTDECATKLDLARAYIDMGDEEGARDILTEVLDEGTEQQQQDAREMMEQLG